MGICRVFLLSHFMKLIEFLDVKNMDLIELGDQDLLSDETHPPTKFRYEFQNKFRSWRTLDLHGDGVEIFDLSIISGQKNCADVLTNYGTSEHVELEVGQYNCWVNIHNFLKIGGIALHVLPLPGEWPNHCRYYYDLNFFKCFEQFGYKIEELQIIWSKQILCKLRKIEGKTFMPYEKFMQIISFKNVDWRIIPKSDNPKNLTW